MADELQHTVLLGSIKSKASLDGFVSIFVERIFHLDDKLCVCVRVCLGSVA